MAKRKRIRNYRLEYKNRIAHGRARGLSVSQARGHARSGVIRRKTLTVADPNDPRERALALMKDGATQKTAAKKYNVSVEKLRRYVKENTTAKLRGKKWIITDRRPEEMRIISGGRLYGIPVPYRFKRSVGQFWKAINKFLDTNNESYLKPLQGKGIRDADGKFHPWETDPNILRKLDSIGELHFVDIYTQTAQ